MANVVHRSLLTATTLVVTKGVVTKGAVAKGLMPKGVGGKGRPAAAGKKDKELAMLALEIYSTSLPHGAAQSVHLLAQDRGELERWANAFNPPKQDDHAYDVHTLRAVPFNFTLVG